MNHFLITGCDGLLGANLHAIWGGDYRVEGLPGRASPAEVVDAVHRLRPASVVLCGSSCRASWDDFDGAAALRRDAAVLRALVRATGQSESHLVLLSSDRLFDGPSLFHHEDDLPRRLAPGLSELRKLERLADDAGGLVVRTHAFGWGPANAESGYAEVLWDHLRDGLTLPFSPEAAASPILASDLAPLLAEAARRRLTGIYHLAGAERVTLGEFARRLADAFGWPADDVRFRADAASSPRRETALDSRRAARELRRHLPRLSDSLARFAQQHQNGYRERVRHSTSARPMLCAV